MSLLEDRIVKILELRASGLEDEAIAAEIGINSNIIRDYEESARRAIEEATSRGVWNLESIAQRAGLSPIATDMFIKFTMILKASYPLAVVKDYGRI